MRKVSLLLLVAVFAAGCTHKPFVSHVHALVTDCDTANVSYAATIKPIVQSNCYVCHSAVATANGGLDLETFSSLKNYLAYGFRGDGVYGSKFYHCILHSQGALPMPPTNVIDTCSLKQVKRWIDMGAPEN
jgi:hypothetical protein